MKKTKDYSSPENTEETYHKLVARQSKKTKLSAHFMINKLLIQLILRTLSNVLWLLLCVINVYSKSAWVI